VDLVQTLKALRWDPPGDLGWVFVLLVPVAVAYAAYVYRRTDAPLTRGFRVLLAGLRALFLLLLLAILCRPVLSIALPSGAGRGVLVLLDRSLSLGLPGARDGETRDDQARRVTTEIEDRLHDVYPVTVAPFGGSVDAPLESGAELPPADRAATAIAGALETGVGTGGPARRPGAILLVTDGTQTAGPDPVPAARRLGIPVASVPLGRSQPVPDLALVRIRGNRDAFLGEKTPLEAVIRLQGLESGPADVRLLDVTDDPVELAKETVDLASGGAERRVGLSFTPEHTGLRFLEIRVDPREGEATSANNRRLIALEVREEKTGVLLLSGSLTWDHTFIRRALAADSTLAVTSGYWRDGAFRAPVRGTAIPPLTAEGLRGTEVVVLDHVAPAQLGRDGAGALTGFVAAGGGLVLITGSEDNALTAWRGTPLEDAIPVSVNRAAVARTAEARLSPTARRHVLFDPSGPGAAPLEAWEDMPPLWVAPGVGGLKATGEALLVTSDAQASTVLSWGPAGQGRVLLVAGGGLWSWDFLSPTHRTAGNVMPAWWRRAAQWLARPVVDTRLDVHPAEWVVARGEPVRFVARALDQAYRPLPDVGVTVDVSPADGGDRRQVTLEGDEGFLRGALEGLGPGKYAYRAEARAGGNPLGTVDGVFVVDSLGAEFERLEPDHEVLERLAEATGGRVWSPDSLSTLARDLETVGRGEAEMRQVDLWDQPWVFAMFVLVGSSEWFLRRRRGLI